MAKVKICGLTNFEDAAAAERLGADYLGFVFFSESVRAVTAEGVKPITAGLEGKARKVGLFYNQGLDFALKTAASCGLDAVQLHGEESQEMVKAFKNAGFTVIKSFKVGEGFEADVTERYGQADYYLFDTFKKGLPGGTGIAFDWGLIRGARFQRPFFLAGGLKPSTVKGAVSALNPYAVDVASGVEERPGKKNVKLMKEFIDAAKG